MRRLSMGIAWVILLGVLSAAAAADQPEAGSEYVGELTGDRVRVRAGGGLNHQILTHVSKGAKVLVRQQKGDWLRIRVPDQVSLWISGKYVKADPSGRTGTVTGRRVNVRARKIKGDVLGQVHAGDQLAIRGRDGTWLKIAPPQRVSAWVYAKYVRNIGGYGQWKSKVEAEASFRDLMGQARDLYEAELKKQPEERDFASVIALYDKGMSLAPGDAAKAEAAARRDFVAAIKEVNDSFIEAMKPYKHLPAKLAELEQKYKAMFEKAAPPEYTANGWVQSLGKVAFRPATHKLVKGGKVLYLIKSADYDLENYRGKYVGVIGQVLQEKSWWGVPVIDVSQIDLLYQGGQGAK